jgi:hypothetical protein
MGRDSIYSPSGAEAVELQTYFAAVGLGDGRTVVDMVAAIGGGDVGGALLSAFRSQYNNDKQNTLVSLKKNQFKDAMTKAISKLSDDANKQLKDLLQLLIHDKLLTGDIMFDSTKVGELQNVPHIALLFKLATQWIEELDGIFGIPDHYRQSFNAGADQSRAMQLHERNRTLVGAPRRVSSPLLEVLALVAAVAIDHFALMGEKAVAAHFPAATSRPKIAASPTAFWIWSVRPAMFSSAEVAKKRKAAEDATTSPPPQAGDALAADAEDFCFVSRESIADADPSVNAGDSNEASATADDEVRAKKKPARGRQAAAASAPVFGGEHSSAIPIVVPEQAVRSPTTSTRAPRSTTIASTSTRTTRSSNRSSARKRYVYTGDSAGPFVQIEGISDDGLVVYGYVDMIDGRRTDGLVPVDRRIDDLCREDAALLARYRSPGE